VNAAEILAELSKLTVEERSAVRHRLRELDERDKPQFLHEAADLTSQEMDKQEVQGGFYEKLQLVEDLWDNIAANPESVPVPDWQKTELKRRKENFLKNPKSGSSWEAVKQRVQNIGQELNLVRV
jgi:putative addiction module component (TIGR02574 family)